MSLDGCVFLATSLDGYLARVDGSVDWLDTFNAKLPENEDGGFGAFLLSVDAMIMGRVTFEQVVGFGVWPYGELPVHILTRDSEYRLPDSCTGNVTVASTGIDALWQGLEAGGATRVYVDGGSTVRAFLIRDLIHEITLTVAPILLGSGIRLFDESPSERQFRPVMTRLIADQFIQNRFVRVTDQARSRLASAPFAG